MRPGLSHLRNLLTPICVVAGIATGAGDLNAQQEEREGFGFSGKLFSVVKAPQVFFSNIEHTEANIDAGAKHPRKLTLEYGLNPARSFREVEVVVQRKVGTAPANYVGNINEYYLAYKPVRKSAREHEAAEASQETNAGEKDDKPSSLRLEEAFLRRLVALGWLR